MDLLSIESLKRKYNSMVNLSTFTSNKIILSRIVVVDYITKFVIKFCQFQNAQFFLWLVEVYA